MSPHRVIVLGGHVLTYEFSEWMAHAACGGSSLFFPEGGSQHGITLEHRRALHTCYRCPVRQECFEHSIKTKEWWGVWGGVLAEWRRPVLRRIRDHPEQAWELAAELYDQSYVKALGMGIFKEAS